MITGQFNLSFQDYKCQIDHRKLVLQFQKKCIFEKSYELIHRNLISKQENEWLIKKWLLWFQGFIRLGRGRASVVWRVRFSHAFVRHGTSRRENTRRFTTRIETAPNAAFKCRRSCSPSNESVDSECCYSDWDFNRTGFVAFACRPRREGLVAGLVWRQEKRKLW